MDTDLRKATIKIMSGFMAEHLYKGQDISEDELLNTAAIYYDLVEGTKEALVSASLEEEKKAMASLGLVDASNPTHVDLMGGPRAIDNSTFAKD